MRLHRFCFCLLLSAVLTSQVNAEIPFLEHVVRDTIEGLQYVTVADVDGDGDQDIIARSTEYGTLVYPGQGNDTFYYHYSILDEGDARGEIVVDDMNGDELPDLVVAMGDYNPSIQWMECIGNNEYVNHSLLDCNNVLCLDVADMDNDGDQDIIAIASYNEEDAFLYCFENSNDHFEPSLIEIQFPQSHEILACDLDQDGDNDIVATFGEDGTIEWWENDGLMIFANHVIVEQVDNPANIAVKDMDSDGDMDILATTSEGNALYCYTNNGECSFTENVIDDELTTAWGIDAADLDWDGDVDIVATAQEAGYVKLYENNGNMTFTESVLVDSFFGAVHVSIADIDDDYMPDVIAAASISEKISTWINLSDPYLFSFYLDYPQRRGIVYNDTVQLAWETTTFCPVTPDPCYFLEWSNRGDYPEESTALVELATTTFSISAFRDGDTVIPFADGDTVYWRVRAFDEYMGKSRWMEGNSSGFWFVIDLTVAPYPAYPVSPGNGCSVEPEFVILEWEPAIDPNPGDTPYYNVWLDTLQTLETAWLVVDSLLCYRRGITNLQEEQEYFWAVYATDANTEGTWSDTFSFVTLLAGVGDLEHDAIPLPSEFSLTRVSPNPFNSTTVVEFFLPHSGVARFRVFDILGRSALELAEQNYSEGYHLLPVEMRNQSSGTYFIQGECEGAVVTSKVILVR